MIENFIFDIDGTILDSKDIYFKSLRLTLEEHKITYSSLPEYLFSLPAKDALKRLHITNIDEVLDTWGEHFNRMNGALQLFDGILDVMKELYYANKKIAIVTSRNRKVANHFCEQTGLKEFISLCVTAEDTNNHKPHPDPIIYAITKLGLAVAETAYIGDTLNDYHAANNAGVRFIAAAWNESAAKLPGFKIFNPLELLKFA